jgi:hypothetical protein
MDSSIFQIFQDMQNPETFAAGKTVFVEGEPGYTMYVVLEGHVEIRLGGKTLEVAGPGSVIGEMALINLCTRSATAIAQDDCTLASVDSAETPIRTERDGDHGQPAPLHGYICVIRKLSCASYLTKLYGQSIVLDLLTP